MRTAKELIPAARLAAAQAKLEDQMLMERGLNEIEAQKHHVQMGVLLGAIGAYQQISEMTGQKALLALMQIRDGKGHLALGYGRFDDFLNDTEKTTKLGLPRTMSYAQFNRLEALYKKEGIQVFDLLTGSIPDYVRRQLPPGTFEFNPETGLLRVGETAIPIEDKSAVIDAVRALHSQIEANRSQAEDQAKKVEQLQKSVIELKEQLETNAPAAPGSDISPLFKLQLQLSGLIQELLEESRYASPEDVARMLAFCDGQVVMLHNALAGSLPTQAQISEGFLDAQS